MFDPSGEQLVPIRFEWRYGGHQVHLCGSFTRWLETVPMALDQTVGGSLFAVVCNLPPGIHQYKFIVDGEWRHDEGQPYMPDPLGNVNNWIFVAIPGSNATAESMQPNMMQPQLPSEGNEPQEGTKPEQSASSSCMDWTSSSGDAAGPFQGSVHPVQPGGPSAADAPLPTHAVSISGAVPGSSGAQAGTGTAGSAPTGTGGLHEFTPEVTRARISEFLHRHTAYELIPESGKVVVLDTSLPVQQAFHALFEQGLPSAPLWDSERQEFVGIISSSDFMNILHRIRSRPVSNAELEQLTISKWRVEAAIESGEVGGARRLVSVRPEDSLHTVAHSLLQCGYKSVPILTFSSLAEGDSNASGMGGALLGHKPREIAQLLHLVTLGGVLASVARHFRHTPNSIPLLSQPIGSLGVGTYRKGIEHDQQGNTLHTLQPSTPLTVAMSRLLQAGVSALPVVDEQGVLLDVYARSDVVALARDQAYSRLPLDEISVAQALAYCNGVPNRNQTNPSPRGRGNTGGGHGEASPGGAGTGTAGASGINEDGSAGGPSGVNKLGRCWTCTRATPLRIVVDALSSPGIQRLVCVAANTNVVEGIVSLRDVASFIFA
uniref:CBS domain-containing protein n=1 Tax=Pyramimonas obovata TaxID=1411642 RepID=A0A7S0WNV7_9CHLO|mmetsp:Transcript_32507/g.71043  ORF Transcript_32507/g.71043 Transcript_32507/m.71043 type:complete len:603 (+) Transcript_32507:144-1952(+)|eukprot:CAMPEP_0118925642 /NCGR_PEP_ID=MMETSP1169-20130426/3499_1 /TAXON_ID=36882 /ORGANISM="Pyramimonas obovata, Strain CCMP722" /LENGTH=602 /DNA_ID=CAMNT_0006866995 /DNA_START=100 /DNA_END=1908 /DNA_ORIENTATION=+